MIAYVDCLSTQPAINCWNCTYYEDQEELLPLYTPKLSNLQPKNGGSLRRRLLISKIQQQQTALQHSRHRDDHTALKGIQKQHSSTFRPTSQECRGRPVSDGGHSPNNHVFITAVSSLDEECKWSVHYTAPWHHEENVFLPGSRPPCVEELHHQAKINLKTVLRECDKLRKDGFRSSQGYTQGPMLSSPVHDGLQNQKEMEKGKKSSDSSAEKDKLLYSMGPQTPLVESICDINSLSSWSKCSPLPTPEEKMRQQALSVATDIIPINITGENFDRQASFRRTLINTDTVIRRSKRIKRRKTITGVPDNIQRELATTEQSGIRSYSMYMPDQHSTLGRVGSANSTLKNSLTCDSGCQTEAVKILPPSMRRIRAQKGHAVHLANISLSSSGSMSNMSDCNAVVYTPQLNNIDQGFHSLPRKGAQNSVLQIEPKCSNYLYQNGSTSSLPSKVNMHHPSPDSQLIPDSPKVAPVSPKSVEFQCFQAKQKASCYRIFNYNNCQAFLSNCATQQNSSNIAHSVQNFCKEETPVEPLSPCSSEQPFGSSAASSCCHSSVSLQMATHTDTESHCSTLDGRTCNIHKCDISESCSALATDLWTCEPTLKDQHTSSCSSSVSHIYTSLERLPRKSDSCSLFSPDAEGYYTSTHLESGLKSYSHGCISKSSKARDNLYECRTHHSQDDSVSLHSNQSLTRSISLRKAKKPPLPPRRTDSLPRKSHRKPRHDDNVLNEQIISNLHESQASHTELLSAQMPFSGFEDPWVLRPRSHSTVSAASSGMSAPAAVCPVTPTHSDSSSQHSEYAELCDIHPECLHSVQGSSFSIESSKQAEENLRQVKNNISSKNCNRSEVNSMMDVLQAKIHIVTSPSSGYSSQSITPTLGTPAVPLLRAKSPAGRPKPKVPERKSSLRSNVSSSCTSLSSNTSDSIKNLPTPPPISKTLVGVLHFQSAPTSPICSSVTTLKMDVAIPPVSPLTVSSSSETNQNSVSLSPTAKDGTGFFNLPSVVSEHLLLNEKEKSPLPLLSPSTIPLVLQSNFQTQSPPPSPGTHLQPVTTTTTDFQIVETAERAKEPYFRHNKTPENHEKPHITAHDLQMVQLRPIKVMNLENIFTDIITTVCDRADKEQDLEPKTNVNRSAETLEILENCVFFDSASHLQDEMHEFESLECPLKTITHNMLSNIHEPISRTKSGENIEKFSLGYEPPASQDILQNTASPTGTLKNEKPPISPKLSLKMSPILSQPTLSVLDPLEVTEPEPEVLSGTSLLDSVDLQEILLQLELEQLQLELEDNSLSFPLGLSSEIPSDNLSGSQLTVLTLKEHETGKSANDLGQINEELDNNGISDENSSELLVFKEDEDDKNDAVFNSSTDSSSSSTNGEITEEMLTPPHPRTTEDLFAVIHRSKRKVLGRCDSEEERSWGFLPSPPVAHTTSCPIMPSMPRQNSFIQRGLRRSSTSSNSFKALLLSKGSRSDPGFRISATEMLKCTDPRLQRATVELLPSSPSPCASPGRNRRASEDWARTEGLLPRLSPSITPSKYGRSSTPPSASSSRYNSRSRILSGPMTVICEREGEVAESADHCIDVDIPFDASLTSSSMLCVQGNI